MSYILDALKKSESETNQSEVPDLSSEHNYGQYQLEDAAKSSWKQWLFPVLIVGLFGACVVFALLWYSQQQSQPEIQGESATTAVSTNEVLEARKEFVIEKQDSTAESSEGGWSITEKEVVVRQPILEKVTPQPQAKTVSAPTTAQDNRASQTASTTNDEKGSYQLSDLPTLIYTTHIYATESKDRFVLLNGKPYEVGSRITPELRVVDILENELQLEYKGQLFTVPSLEDINPR